MILYKKYLGGLKVTISNEFLTVLILTMVSEIQSVKKDRKGFFWHGDPEV